jgi:hypothetical protein
MFMVRQSQLVSAFLRGSSCRLRRVRAGIPSLLSTEGFNADKAPDVARHLAYYHSSGRQSYNSFSNLSHVVALVPNPKMKTIRIGLIGSQFVSSIRFESPRWLPGVAHSGGRPL